MRASSHRRSPHCHIAMGPRSHRDPGAIASRCRGDRIATPAAMIPMSRRSDRKAAHTRSRRHEGPIAIWRLSDRHVTKTRWRYGACPIAMSPRPALYAGGVPEISRWQAPKARRHRFRGAKTHPTPEGSWRGAGTPAGVRCSCRTLTRWRHAFGACHRLMSVTPPACTTSRAGWRILGAVRCARPNVDRPEDSSRVRNSGSITR